MKQKHFKDKYPIFYREIAKAASPYKTVTQFLDYFEDKIIAHDKAEVIARFDHYTHTKNVDGDISEDIKDAKHIIMCFGWELLSADPVAVRPRSIGVTEYGDKFVVNFLLAPNPIAQQLLEEWVDEI
jgi:hypothetical protein